MAKVLTPAIMKVDEMVVAALKRKICPTKDAPDLKRAGRKSKVLSSPAVLGG